MPPAMKQRLSIVLCLPKRLAFPISNECFSRGQTNRGGVADA